MLSIYEWLINLLAKATIQQQVSVLLSALSFQVSEDDI
jgi:hypothetical protein